MNVNSLAIARLYRNVLDESLAAARDTVGGDLAAEAKISDAFGASIPTRVPSYLADKAASPSLPAASCRRGSVARSYLLVAATASRRVRGGGRGGGQGDGVIPGSESL